MPAATNSHGEAVYDWPAKYWSGDDTDWDRLRAWRSEENVLREGLLAVLKQIGRIPELREYARFISELANGHLKMSRAITFHLPYFGPLDKNQEIIEPSRWPLGLAPELDIIANRLML